MGDIPRGNRPLSPHLSVYRLPATAITSILVRITGQAVVAGILLIVWWIVAAAAGPRSFAHADAVVRSWFGLVILFGACWALWYHFLGGIRHFFYDSGLLLEKDEARGASWFIIAASVVLTILTAIAVIF